MTTPQVQALLEELVVQNRRTGELLQQLAAALGTPGAPAAQAAPWHQPTAVAAPVDNFTSDHGMPIQVVEFVAQGKMINAIKAYREATGAGLAEAKAAVERYRDSLGYR